MSIPAIRRLWDLKDQRFSTDAIAEELGRSARTIDKYVNLGRPLEADQARRMRDQHNEGLVDALRSPRSRVRVTAPYDPGRATRPASIAVEQRRGGLPMDLKNGEPLAFLGDDAGYLRQHLSRRAEGLLLEAWSMAAEQYQEQYAALFISVVKAIEQSIALLWDPPPGEVGASHHLLAVAFAEGSAQACKRSRFNLERLTIGLGTPLSQLTLIDRVLAWGLPAQLEPVLDVLRGTVDDVAGCKEADELWKSYRQVEEEAGGPEKALAAMVERGIVPGACDFCKAIKGWAAGTSSSAV
jgi:hypothetical protein